MNEYAMEYLNLSDLIVERSLHIGAPVDVRLTTMVKIANSDELPTGFLAECHLLSRMTERAYTVAVRVRQRIKQHSAIDPINSNLLETLSRGLDKQVCPLCSHMR